MKNFLMCALILCAIPAVAFGQTVTCDDCTHDVSVYMGSGGLIAETDADEVVFVATCGGVTTSGKLMPNDDGMVATLFDDDNGLACHSAHEGNRMQLGPVMDGGWFWINDEMSSAVGNLVNHKIMDNEMTEIADAGDGVTSMMGKGAVFLKETKSGRVGILPTILPVEPPPATVMCGPRLNGAGTAYTWQQTSKCMLGGGGTKIRLRGPAAYNSRGTITNGMVTRPSSGTITVNADLWVDESGSYSTGTTPTLGWAGKVRAGNNWLDTRFAVSMANTPVGVAGDAALIAAGVSITPGNLVVGNAELDSQADNGGGSDPLGQATIVIAASGSYCPTSATGTQSSAIVDILAHHTVGGNRNPNNLAPRPSALAREDGNSPLRFFTAHTQLTIMCPPRSAANQGTDLVPENPFPPTTE